MSDRIFSGPMIDKMLAENAAQAARIEQLEAALGAPSRRAYQVGVAVGRASGITEAAFSSCATDFNDPDEVRVWEYARHKILALLNKEPKP